MRKSTSFIIIALSIAVVGIAGAADKMLYDNKSKPAVPIQNLGALAPTKGKLRCDTTALTKASFKGYSTAGYLGNTIQVVDAAGAPVNVKWSLDGVQTWIGSIFTFTNAGGTTYTKAAFQPYSATSRSLTSCTVRQ